MTKRIEELVEQRVVVKVLRDARGHIHSDEQCLLNSTRSTGHVREITLNAGGRTLLVARTVFSARRLRLNRKLRRLGSRPLGELLFLKGEAKWSKREFGKVSSRHPVFDLIKLAIPKQSANGWVRRTVFIFNSCPILVTEVFLPDLLDAKCIQLEGKMSNKPLSTKQIKQRLPHRFPFLMIDRVLKYGGDEAVAIKNVSINESYFEGHFPSEPVMPGVLLGECMAQTAAFIGGSEPDDEENVSLGSKAFLTGINLKIERPVVPGDQITIKARLVKRLGKLMKISAQATVDTVVVASAELTIASM